MNKEQYKKIIFETTAGVRDVLREVVEWIDGVLAKSRERDLELREKTMDDETNLDGKIVAESLGDTELFGLKKIEGALKTEWFLTPKDVGVLKLNYKEFQTFKSALKEVLEKQPFGYEKLLKHPLKVAEISVLKKEGKVYLTFGREKPIYIAEAEDNQGELLSLLGDPRFGVARSMEVVGEALEVKENSSYLKPTTIKRAITNAVKEIQSKLSQKGKGGILSCHFEGNNVWLETK